MYTRWRFMMYCHSDQRIYLYETHNYDEASAIFSQMMEGKLPVTGFVYQYHDMHCEWSKLHVTKKDTEVFEAFMLTNKQPIIQIQSMSEIQVVS